LFFEKIHSIKESRVVEFKRDSFYTNGNVRGYCSRKDSIGENVGGGNIPHAIKKKVRKLEKSGFTLMELLMGIAVGGMAVTGMLVATMSYLKIWEMVSGDEGNENFNREIVTHRFVSNEISMCFMGMDNVDGNPSLTFRKLNGTPAIYDHSEAYLYWESRNEIPFLRHDQGGITQFWLKCETRWNGAGAVVPEELRLYYGSSLPTQKPDYSGGVGAPQTMLCS
jgi:prepilin-type N-terminal cleavage/methylation domain-containing protein